MNAAVVDFALEAKAMGLNTVAFTSVDHSSAVPSRHESGKRLFEVCDHVVDICGFRGDSAIELVPGVRGGPLSSLTSIFLAHSLITTVCRELEAAGIPCVYTSVNTPEGESKNKAIEKKAAIFGVRSSTRTTGGPAVGSRKSATSGITKDGPPAR